MLVQSPVSVEKLSSPKMPGEQFALGCPPNEFLGFPDIQQTRVITTVADGELLFALIPLRC